MVPIILGIDTSTVACSVAIQMGSQVWMEMEICQQKQAKLLLNMIDTVLHQASIDLRDVDAFAFGIGPGSFTGLRIAASAIQGLAFGTNKPIIGISTLQALSQQAYEIHQASQVLASLDAKMKEVYWGLYRVNSEHLMQPQQADVVQEPYKINISPEFDGIAIGDGFLAYQDYFLQQMPHLKILSDILYPRASELVKLANAKFIQGKCAIASEAIPIYLRNI